MDASARLDDFDPRKTLPRRSIIPLIHPSSKHAPVTRGKRNLRFGGVTDEELPDLNDVQGDVIYLFPKRAENFIFFRIAQVGSFRKALGEFRPSSSNDVANFICEIADRRRSVRAGERLPLIPKSSYQIAFTRMGMNYLGVRGATGDVRFDRHAMRDDREMLGDQRQWDPEFDKPNPDPINGSANRDEGALHGVITVAGSDPITCKKASDSVKELFGSSIKIISTLEGRARPGAFAGHEHFGYEDGVSQPALRNLTQPNPGQIQVDPGVIIMGYKGDPVVDDPDGVDERPAWTKGGTIMVFRKLEQSVPEFDAYLEKNGRRWREFAPPGCPELTDKEGAGLWGARLVGRWKSGAPLAICRYKDDPELALDSSRNNDFDYHVRDVPGVSPRALTDIFCPFFAHTRKTAPRSLDPYIQRAFLESSMIVRAGLPYGPEVEEDPDAQRGLLFVCYQSSLDQGFVRQTAAFANNNYFPIASLSPLHHGQDPLLGGPPPANSASAVTEVSFIADPKVPPQSGDQVNFVMNHNGARIEVSGFAKVKPPHAADPPGVPQEFFVTSHGGEYFFVPPISTLKAWVSGGGCTGLDIMLVVDATSSMQKYIDAARGRISAIYDDITKSGEWSPGDVRIGIVVFRDHPQLDRRGVQQSYGFVTKVFDFESDINVVNANLGSLEASGGGDGPEAQCDALNETLQSAWKDGAVKVALMITDSPTHGLDEYEDRLPDGCPEQNDCVRIAHLMADTGITLHVLACEPTLSGSFSTAHDFYAGLTKITGGKLLSLTDEAALREIISGITSEAVDIQRLATEHRAGIASQARSGAIATTICKDLYNRLSSSGTQIHSFSMDNVYEIDGDSEYNANVWANAKQIDPATKSSLRKIRGFRIKEEYRRGGSRYQQALEVKLDVRAITQDQVNTVVATALRAN